MCLQVHNLQLWNPFFQEEPPSKGHPPARQTIPNHITEFERTSINFKNRKLKTQSSSNETITLWKPMVVNNFGLIITRITASLAAIVSISAQETIPGHSDSRLFFILSMILKPLRECMLLEAFFSPSNVIVSSSRIDPSHPYFKS